MEHNERKFVTIKIKRRISGEPGPPSFLQNGELAFNENDGVLFTQTTETKSLTSND